jgi:hypothetical protein
LLNTTLKDRFNDLVEAEISNKSTKSKLIALNRPTLTTLPTQKQITEVGSANERVRRESTLIPQVLSMENKIKY